MSEDLSKRAARKKAKNQTKKHNAQQAAVERTHSDHLVINQIALTLEDLAFAPSICDTVSDILNDNATEYQSLITSICSEITMLHNTAHVDDSIKLPVVTSLEPITFNQQLYSFLNVLGCSFIDRCNPKQLTSRLSTRIDILDWLSAQLQAYRMLISMTYMPENAESSIDESNQTLDQLEHDIVELARLLNVKDVNHSIDASSLMSAINESLTNVLEMEPSIRRKPLFDQQSFSDQQLHTFQERFVTLQRDLNERVAALLYRFELTMKAMIPKSKTTTDLSLFRSRVAYVKSSAHSLSLLGEYEVWCAGSELIEQQQRVGLVNLRENGDLLVTREAGIPNIPDRGGRMSTAEPASPDEESRVEGKFHKNRKRKLSSADQGPSGNAEMTD